MKDILLYGLQRSGTNYLETLLTTNFEVEMHMNHYTYSLPIHKHFRPYSKPWFFPHLNLLHDFHYDSFQQFDEHCQKLTQKNDLKYVVISKEPFSWYLSFCRFARKEKIFYHMKRRYVNQMYMIDYSLFFEKWLQFAEESPNKVIVVQYEELLKDFKGQLNAIKEKIGLVPKTNEYINPSKVNMSKKFTPEKKKAYIKAEAYQKFREDELLVLAENLKADVVKKLGYELHHPIEKTT